MPIGTYPYQSDSTGDPWQQASAISAPPSEWGTAPGHSVQAKEPDRQSATRRGSQSGRGRSAMAEADEEHSQPRSRSAQRSSANRRGAQARRAATQSTRRATAPARQKKSRRGFAAMSAEQQREIARKGGLTVSRNRRHMADIGRIGGEHSHGGRRARR